MTQAAIDALLEEVAWAPTEQAPAPDGLPYATHAGVFKFGDIELRCYRLNDGRAIFHADDFRKAFGDFLRSPASSADTR